MTDLPLNWDWAWLAGVLDLLPPPVVASLSEVLNILQAGGMSMTALLVLGVLLWFALGYRFAALGIGRGGLARRRLKRFRDAPDKRPRSLLDKAARDAVRAREDALLSQGSLRHFVMGSLYPYRETTARFSTTIKAIVIVAPLIGLLGTVSGMIETFEALQSMSVFSQSSSIAGGISKALYTTQMGLVVGLPGLLLGRMLDRRQVVINDELDQLVNLAALPQRQAAS